MPSVFCQKGVKSIKRCFAVCCLLVCCLLSACTAFQAPLWRPDPMIPVESNDERADAMGKFCKTGAYKGQLFSELTGSADAFCQQEEKGTKLCAVLLVYPETRYYAYTDGRHYAATVQAKSWFNFIVDSNELVKKCWVEKE